MSVGLESFADMEFSEEDLTRSICREKFSCFVKEFWDEIPGVGPLIWNWHLDHISDSLQFVAERVFKGLPVEHDLVYNISPGTSKSSLISILFPTWVWTRMPKARFISATHTDSLALDLSVKARSVVRSDKYRTLFPEIELVEDQDAKGHYRNTLGGSRLTCTVAGKTPMGFHADFQIVDDPLDPRKAVSEAELKNANDFMTQVLPSRKTNKMVSVMILVMQRLHRNDPSATILSNAEKEGTTLVRHYCIPCDTSWEINPPELKEKYVDGLMDPVRLSRTVLRNFEVTLGPYGYAGQFGQAPRHHAGGLFREQYFNQRVRAAPYHVLKRIRGWDRASSVSETACYTAGVLMSLGHDGNLYIEDCVHERLEPDERNRKIRATALKDRGRYGPREEPLIYIEREGGSSGRDAWKGIARELAGFSVREDTVTGKKDVRAEPWSCALAAGLVYLVDNGESDGTGKATWDINGFIQEHLMFKPEGSNRLGRYKDIVDATTLCYNRLVGPKSDRGIRIYSRADPDKKAKNRIVVCSREDLNTLVIEHKTLLILISNPEISFQSENDNTKLEVKVLPTETPSGGLMLLLDTLSLSFVDLAPEEVQESWESPVEPWNEPAEKLVFNQDQGKKVWSNLLKKRPEAWEVLVIVDDGGSDRRALSMAYAVCDILRLPRSVIYQVNGDEDFDHKENTPPNPHVHAMVKSTRGLVVG